MKATGNSPSVFVVLVSYQAATWITRCLDSLRASDYPVTCVVVDNASSDDTCALINHAYPEVVVLRQERNLGFGGANNLGMCYALSKGAEYVFLLNQDAWIDPNTIRGLVEVAEKYPTYGIISPLHVNYEGTNLEHYFTTIISPPECPGLIRALYSRQFDELYPIQFIHAAAWFLSRACVEKTGGFDPVFFHYSEDIDWVQRARYWGFEVGVAPAIRVAHYGTHAGLNTGRNYAFERNFALLALKDVRSKSLGQILLFIKTRFDRITTALLFGRWNDLRFECKLGWEIIRRLPELKRMRRACRQAGAYLNTQQPNQAGQPVAQKTKA